MNYKKINGIIAPMVTPLLGYDTIDTEGTHRLVEHLVAGGVSALFVLGTTGEGPSLSHALRRKFIRTVSDSLDGRLPMLVAVSDTSMAESLSLAHEAENCGAMAVAATPPYYFSGNISELVCYYKALADRLPLPLFLYNIPSRVKVSISVAAIRELSSHPNIVGVKDSSADMTYFSSLLLNFRGKDFPVYMGPEEQTAAAVLLGADGAVNGGANLYPELFVSLFKAAASGKIGEVRRLQDKLMFLSDSLYHLLPDSDGSFIAAIKCALHLKGICSSCLAYPFRPIGGNLERKVSDVLALLDSKGYT